MREVYIAPHEGKGRTFQALLLASLEANALWPGGQTSNEDTRPVWAMFAGSDPELRAFTANLLTGRKALFGQADGYRPKRQQKLELLKSAGYQYAWQRESEGSVVTAFLPDLFRLDPGMVDPAGARFVCLPAKAWCHAQAIDTAPLVEHMADLGCTMSASQLVALAPLAFLFAAYLDRRTRCPLVADGRFYLQLLVACLRDGLASWPAGDRDRYRDPPFGVHGRFALREESTSEVGLERPVAFEAGHQDLERVLAAEVQRFFETVRR